jgi:hypothetical protein
VLVVETIVGTACATRCLPCADAGAFPRWPSISAAWCTAEHVLHRRAVDPALIVLQAVAR